MTADAFPARLGVENALDTVLQERNKKALGERRRGKDH